MNILVIGNGFDLAWGKKNLTEVLQGILIWLASQKQPKQSKAVRLLAQPPLLAARLLIENQIRIAKISRTSDMMRKGNP